MKNLTVQMYMFFFNKDKKYSVTAEKPPEWIIKYFLIVNIDFVVISNMSSVCLCVPDMGSSVYQVCDPVCTRHAIHKARFCLFISPKRNMFVEAEIHYRWLAVQAVSK